MFCCFDTCGCSHLKQWYWFYLHSKNLTLYICLAISPVKNLSCVYMQMYIYFQNLQVVGDSLLELFSLTLTVSQCHDFWEKNNWSRDYLLIKLMKLSTLSGISIRILQYVTCHVYVPDLSMFVLMMGSWVTEIAAFVIALPATSHLDKQQNGKCPCRDVLRIRMVKAFTV